MAVSNNYYKKKPTDKIWWLEDPYTVGLWRFTFDRVKIYYFYQDYPQALTPEQLEIFNAENPELAERFGDN